MAEEMLTVNVKEIMEEIRQNIKDQGYTESLLSFQDVKPKEYIAGNGKLDLQKLHRVLNVVNEKQKIEYYHQFIPHRGVKNIIKAGIRKILRFLIQPFTETQTEFNVSSALTLNQISYFIIEQLNQNEEYETKIAELEKRIKELEKRG